MTTGRINQVATLADAARARPVPARPRPSLSLSLGLAEFRLEGTCAGRRSRPASAACTASVSAARPLVPTGRVGTRERPRGPPKPLAGRRGDRDIRGVRFRSIGSQRRNRVRHPGRGRGMRGIVSPPFGARARSRPTGTIRSPLTRPHVRTGRRIPTPHPPRAVAAREQMEALRSASPAPLGMTFDSGQATLD